MVSLQLDKIKRPNMLLYIALLAAGVWAIYPVVFRPSIPAVTVSSGQKPATVSASLPVMPQGYRQQAVRDPFQLPKELVPQPITLSATVSRADQSAAQPAKPQFELRGVAIGNGTAAAILESSAGSCSYRVGEYAGPYQVRSITADSVVLDGPSGQHLLTMRR